MRITQLIVTHSRSKARHVTPLASDAMILAARSSSLKHSMPVSARENEKIHLENISSTWISITQIGDAYFWDKITFKIRSPVNIRFEGQFSKVVAHVELFDEFLLSRSLVVLRDQHLSNTCFLNKANM